MPLPIVGAIAAGVGRVAAAGAARAGAGKLAQGAANIGGRYATFKAFSDPNKDDYDRQPRAGREGY